MKKTIPWLLTLLSFFGLEPVVAATQYDSQDYDLYSGDFNGDGLTDILYVAKSANMASGIALSSGTNGPSATDSPGQSWPSNYLGIQWWGNAYNVIVADFNGDGKSDLLLQAKAAGGTSYLLLAQPGGTFTTISQPLPNGTIGVNWSADQQAIVAGVFTSGRRAGVFLQATSPSGTDWIVLTDANGLFTLAPEQNWSDGFLNLKWSTRNATVYAADFNGDGLTDLLVQQKPTWVEINYDVPFPVPTLPGSFNGLALAAATTPIFGASTQLPWSRHSNGVDWSSLAGNLVIGDFNGDGCADILFQAKHTGQTTYILNASSCKSSGQVFPTTATATAVSSNVAISADSAKLIVGNYSGGAAAGLYIQATATSGSDAIANSVSSAITATTHDLTRTSPQQPTTGTTVAGSTPTSASVSSNGSSSYSIPLKLPPGTAGMTPEISLAYHGDRHEGILGMGWSLTGQSAISRCSSTYAQDGVDAGVTLTETDQYCLDGKRLRLRDGYTQGADGSEYGTEIEGFSLIIAHGSTATPSNGPAWFEVRGADGRIYQYGNTTDSQIPALGTSIPQTWALNQIADRSTNYINFSYLNDTTFGGYHLDRIRYTGNVNQGVTPTYMVTMGYADRAPSDLLLSYFAGYPMREPQMLNQIVIANGTTIIRTYNFVYQGEYAPLPGQRTLLSSVQECSGTGFCFAPTTFTWQSASAGWNTSTATTSDANTSATRIAFLDLNGDGIPDALWSEPPNYNLACYALGSPTGLQPKQCSTSIPFTYNAASTSRWTEVQREYVADFRGDGRQEFLQYNSKGTYWELLYLDPGTNTLQELPLIFTIPGVGYELTSQTIIGFADVDGDGRDDLIYYNQVDLAGGIPYATQGIRARLSNGSGFGDAQVIYPMSSIPSSIPCTILRGGDFGRSGRADLIIDFGGACTQEGPQTSWEVFSPSGSSSAVTLTQVATIPVVIPYAFPPIIADFNGDGIDDVAYVQYSGTTAYLYAMFGTGRSSAPLTSSISTNISLPNPGQVFAADYDGDGRADIIYGNTSWFVAQSQGDSAASGGLFATPFSSEISSSASTVAFALDMKGRGLTDLVSLPSSGTGPVTSYAAKGPYSDLLQSATDGYNNVVQFSYAPLTSGPPFYAKGNTAQFPSFDYEGSVYVVSSESLSDGIGGQYTLSYSYGGAQVDRQGRGFLGFGQTSVTDSRTGFKEERQYDLTFPYTGLLLQDDLWQSNGKTVFHASNTASAQTVSATANQQRYFPYIQQSSQSRYEVFAGGAQDGEPITTSTETYGFDSYGNLTSDSKTVTDADTGSPYYNQTWTTAVSKTPDIDPSGSTNSADVSTWCTALIDQTTESYTTTTSPSGIVRTTQYVPDTDPTQCRIRHVIVEPGNATYQVTTDLGFDGFGNLTSSTVTGVSMPSSPASRVTSIGWDAAGHFPTSITNPMYPSTSPLAQTTLLSFDPNFGSITKVTDPNGAFTSWHYDTLGRLDTQTGADKTAAAWSYGFCATLGCVNSNNRMTVTETDLNADGSVLGTGNTYLDSFGRPLVASTVTLNGAYDRNEVQYDALGRVQQQAAPCFWSGCTPYWTINSYDTLGRLLQSQRPVNASSGQTQNLILRYFGRTTTQRDGNGNTTVYVNDVNGLLRRIGDPTGYYVTLAYDAAGSNTGATDQLGNTLFSASYDYGVDAFPRDVTDMDLDVSSQPGQHAHYNYDSLGEMVSWSDAKGQNFSTTYDALSRPVTRTEPDLLTRWTWGTSAAAFNIGALAQVCTGTVAADIAAGNCDASGFAESETYDFATRISSRSIVIPSAGSFTYGWQYDGNTGLLGGVTYPTSTPGYALQLAYNYLNGVLQSIQDPQDSVTVWKANSANALGQITQETLGNGIVRSRNYDAVTGWLGTVQAGPNGSASSQNMGFLYDQNGNVTQRQDNNLGLTENFYPDILNRLDHTTGPSALQMHYDVMGNITSRSDIASGATWTYDPVHKHRVLTAGDSNHTYTYDNNGNVITRNGNSINWSSYNYPISVSSGSGSTAETLTFSYGPDRQRWQQVYTGNGVTETTNYIGDGLEQVISGGVTDFRHYIYAGNEPVAVYSRKSTGVNGFSYVLDDHQGSVTSLTDASGASVVNESFTPFGTRRNPSTWGADAPTNGVLTAINGITQHGYTFQTALGLWTGLNHMNGRVQDAVTGRFLSADPFVPDPTNTQDYNRYSYADNNPLTLTDPSGFDPTCDGSDCFDLDNITIPLQGAVQTGVRLGNLTGTVTIEGLDSDSNTPNTPYIVSPGIGPGAIDYDGLNAELAAHPGYAAWAYTQYSGGSAAASGVLSNLQPNLNDYLNLLTLGYFERPAAQPLPKGMILMGLPPEHFHAFSDPVAAMGYQRARDFSMQILSLASLVATPEAGLGAAMAARGGGDIVLIDSNAVAQLGKDVTLGGRLLSGERGMVSYVTGPELRNAVARGSLRGTPRALESLEVLSQRPSINAIINFRGNLIKLRGRFGDGIIGAQALEFGIPLVTNDAELAAAVRAAGGIVR